MRHVGMAAAGLFGGIAGLVALGIGIHLAFQAMFRADPGSLYVALLLLLLGGAVIGGVLVAGRVSWAAPFTGGGLLLLVAVFGTVFPRNVFSIDGVGMGAVTAGPLAVVVLLGAVVMRRSRSAAPGPHPGPYAPGSGPYQPGPYQPGLYQPGPHQPGPHPLSPPYAPGTAAVPWGGAGPGVAGGSPPGSVPPAG